jgi:hypothetical protein
VTDERGFGSAVLVGYEIHVERMRSTRRSKVIGRYLAAIGSMDARYAH